MRLDPIDLATPLDATVAASPDWSNASEPTPDAGFEMVHDLQSEPIADGDKEAFPSLRFDFIARTGLHHDVHRNNVGEIGLDRDQSQSVRQILLRVRIRKDFLGRRSLGCLRKHTSSDHQRE